MDNFTDFSSDTEVMIASKYYDLEKPTKSQRLAWKPSPHGIRKCLKPRPLPTEDSKTAMSDGELDDFLVDIAAQQSVPKQRLDVAEFEGDDHNDENESVLSSEAGGGGGDKEDDTGVYEPLSAAQESCRVVIFDNGPDDDDVDDEELDCQEEQHPSAAQTIAGPSVMDFLESASSSSDSSCCIIEEIPKEGASKSTDVPAAKATSSSDLAEPKYTLQSPKTPASVPASSQETREKKPAIGEVVFGLDDPYHNTWKMGRVIGYKYNKEDGKSYYTVEFSVKSSTEEDDADDDDDGDVDEAVSPVHLRRKAQLPLLRKKGSKKTKNDERSNSFSDFEEENGDDDDDDSSSLPPPTFRVDKFLSAKCKTNYKRTVFSLELDETSVAYYDRRERAVKGQQLLPIGSRVVADYTFEFHELSLDPSAASSERYETAENSDELQIRSEFKSNQYFSSGTIISTPSESNTHRYLVFFDNGCISYLKPAYLFPIVSLTEIPQARLHVDHYQFLQNFFRDYPELPLVSLEEGQFVLVYSNEKWMPAKVVAVDALIVTLRISIDAIETEIHKSLANSGAKRKAVGGGKSAIGPACSKQRLEVYPDTLVLYRGSYRLFPLYERIIKNICSNEARSRLNLLASSQEHFSEYEKFVKDKYEKPAAPPPPAQKKYLSLFASTIFPKRGLKDYYFKVMSEMMIHVKKMSNGSATDMRVKQGDIRYLDLEANVCTQVVNFVEHPCSKVCVSKLETGFKQVHAINPLLYPLLHGWQRHVSSQSRCISIASKKWITYTAPCGRILRSTGEVDRYLYLTDSQLTIDMFAFDSEIHVNREFEANAKYLSIHDMTKGVEQTPISCVNCIDTTLPDEFIYSPNRVAREGVPLVTDGSEMEGCNCTDNCRDRSKCACWRKTFEATLFTNREINTKIGYRGRRLPDMLNTGIFECNSKCKCDCRCTNRVVQNGLKLRLQLYKTANKGWGLRCLDDIPKGTFICVYNGELLTEEQSDERGKMLGDEYFAELDFLDCLRRFLGTNISELSAGGGQAMSWSLPVHDDASKKKKNKQGAGEDAYQRPRLKLQSTNRKPGGEASGGTGGGGVGNEIECIFLDSDEDEQDIEEFKLNHYRPYSADEERDRLKCQSRQESVNSNRYFTSASYKRTFDNLLKDETVYIMDAKLLGNIGRYFNHSCAPNLFVQNVFVDTYDLRFPWIAFFASQSIRAGTELSWDYNYTIDSVKNRKLYCYCGAANCRGRLL